MDQKEFKQWLLSAQQYCMPRLIRMTKSKADAEDAFMEAAFQFWQDLQAGKVKDKRNLKGLLFVMAKNVFLGKKRKQNRKSFREYATDPQQLHVHEGNLMKSGEAEAYDSLVQQEEEMQALMADQQRKKAFNQAMKTLEKKCQQLLMEFIGHNVRLKELQQRMGFTSVDAVKTAKYRCKKKLVDSFKIKLSGVTK